MPQDPHTGNDVVGDLPEILAHGMSFRFASCRSTERRRLLETTVLTYAAFNLVAALISYPAGSLSDRWGRKNTLLASFVIFLIAYLGFALT